jgi:predicted SAM-dependent methyltransferase
MGKFTNNSIGLHWYAGHNLAGDFLRSTNGGVNNPKTCVFGKTLAALVSKPLTTYINNLISNRNAMILDIGCGDKQIIRSLKGVHTTLDIWKKFEPDILWDLNNIPLPFQSDSFEIVLMLDVIEHLTKENGEKLLEEVKRITSSKIVLFTPLWWTENIYYMNDPHSAYFENSYERHQSLWVREDFKEGWGEVKELDFIGNYYFGVWSKK